MLIQKESPKLSSNDASSLALNFYGIEVAQEPTTLSSYLDQNFLIRDNEGKKYVLKIANASENEATLDLQNRAMAHLATKGFEGKIQTVFLSKNKKEIESISYQDETYLVRLLPFLEGNILAKTYPQKPNLMEDIGQFLGKVDLALEDFEHAGAHRMMQWDIAQSEKIIGDYIQYFKDENQRDLISFFYQRFVEKTAQKISSFRKQIIHADANNYNLLVGQDAQQFGKFNCRGLLDFGDIVYTQTINELAIAIAYAMQDKANPLEAILPMVKGYHAENKLEEEELSVLFDLACIRLCLTLTNGAYRRSFESLNDYRDGREKLAWTLLEKLKNISPEYAKTRFRHVCNYTVTKKSKSSLSWIKSNSQYFEKPIRFDLEKEKYLVFDLSVGSEEFIGYDWKDKKSVSDHLVQRMEKEGCNIGITKYDEARLFFTSDKFKVPNDDYDEVRNVHLGMDFITKVGTPVQTVCEGEVHHIIYNEPDKDLKNAIVLKHEPEEGICFFTIYGNVETTLKIGDKIEKGQPIGSVVFIENWSPHLHFQLALDMVGFDENFPVSTSPEILPRTFWKTVSPDPNLMLQLPDNQLSNEHYSVDEIIEKRSKHLGKNQKYYYQNPINFVRSKAQFFYDENGRKYLDSLNNVTHVGHCHPKVVEAITKQSQLLNTNSRLVYEGMARYAERLVATLPEPLSVCYFVCTGSEANDLALRLARHYTGQHDMLILDGSYHGNTTAVEQISPNRFDGPGGKGAMPFIHKIPQPNLYRGKYQYGDENSGEKYGEAAKKIIDDLHKNGKGIAGMIAESLMGTAGQVVLPDGFLKTVFKHVRAAGGLCISDEVQVGFGRTGEKFWCFETQDVVPDIVVMGKPIANGFPMGMVVTTPAVAEKYDTGMKYFNTFGGNPVACAAGLAVLDIVENENLQQRANEVGNYFLEKLKELKTKYELIGDVRGKGLYLGIEFVKNRETKIPAKVENYYIAERMKEKGIIIYPNGKFDNCLKIKPPMVFDKNDVDFFVNTLDDILSESVFQ